jgi:aspartate racemase
MSMQTIGMIGGMSWESTAVYYRSLNELVKERLGGLHSAKVVLYSVDFHEVERMQMAADWDAAGRLLAVAARALELAGADFIVLATNTMHKVADAIESAVAIPLLHIADAAGEAIRASGHARVGLLGTRFVMEEVFYRERLHDRFGIDVIVPPPADRELVHRVIYDELCVGKIRDESRAQYRRIIADLVAQGAQAVVLGCTEIALLVGAADASVPLFDTTAIHVRVAVARALAPRGDAGGVAR